MDFFCPECGTSCPEFAAFCHNCGFNLGKLKEASDLFIIKNHLESKNYAVEREFGETTNSKLFLAENTETGEKVIVSFLKKEMDDEVKNYFIRGVEINKSIPHKNILKIYDLDTINGRPYYLSEYAENGQLFWLLNKYGTSGMPVEEAIQYTIKILDGLDAIHKAGFIHRNIKPESIFILKNGEPVLAEFSLGVATEKNIITDKLEGTLEYMSPERCKLSKSVDKRSDIYSVGIMLYQLITGNLPFTGDRDALIFKQTNEKLPIITYKVLAKGLNSIISGKEKLYLASGEIQNILEKACAKGKSSRFGTALEFAGVLKSFLDFVQEPFDRLQKEDKWKALTHYRADHNAKTSDDRLGIKDSVDAFARLISSRSVHPPLSVGLFGNWGAGKSFFMDKLSSEIDRISAEVRKEIKNGRKENELLFYGNIAQIEFNTWHFVDANLWASLVNHIFTNLKIKDEPVDEVKERRNFLIKRIESERNGLKDLEKDLKKYEEEKSEIVKKIESKGKLYKQVALTLFKKTIGEDLKNKISEGDIKEWCKKSGVPYDSTKDYAEQLHEIYEKSLSSKEKTASFIEECKSRFGLYFYIAIVSALLFSLILSFTVIYSFFPENYFTNLFTTSISDLKTFLAETGKAILTFISPLLAFGAGLKVWADKYLKWAPTFFKKIKETVPGLEAELKKTEEEKRQKLEELDKEKQDILAKQEKVQSSISTMEEELDKTTEGDYLSTFIKGRMGTDDYTKHLGLQAKIRSDFEKLSELIERYNKSLLNGEVTNNDNFMINRVVLYIDDLDRCPPDKVVEVLQAVHLLLSFPAFVVVVAVDARWVSQSLRIGYRELFGEEENGVDVDGDGVPDNFRATPHDYLEKIFQIPFWLYPMNIEGRRNLLSQLLETNLDLSSNHPASVSKEDREENASSAGENQIENKEKNSNSETNKPEITESNNPNPVSAESVPAFKLELAAATSEQLSIRKEENDFSMTLAPILGQSPRALKRFVNVYLLIKVGLSDLQWMIYYEKVHPFTGEKDGAGSIRNYQAVMFLLAVITGLPATSRVFFRTLRTRTLKTLGELFNEIDVKKVDGKWFIIGTPAEELSIRRKIAERDLPELNNQKPAVLTSNDINKYYMQMELLQFTKWLDREKRDWDSVDLEQLRYWDPVVSRYSFRVEPIDRD